MKVPHTLSLYRGEKKQFDFTAIDRRRPLLSTFKPPIFLHVRKKEKKKEVHTACFYYIYC
jgi:hypothetical protein